MASGPSVDTGIDMLNMVFGGDTDVRFWTAAPGRDGTGGTEVSGGGYAPAVVAFNGAAAGTGGQIAKVTNQGAFFVADMPVASSDVVAVSVHEHSTGALKWLNDSWSSPVPWSVGQSPSFGAGVLAIAFVPVA